MTPERVIALAELLATYLESKAVLEKELLPDARGVIAFEHETQQDIRDLQVQRNAVAHGIRTAIGDEWYDICQMVARDIVLRRTTERLL